MDQDKLTYSSYNNFSEEQMDFLFSDEKFVNFLSHYFSSYDYDLQPINGKTVFEKDPQHVLIFLRVILANIKNFLSYFEMLNRNISYLYHKEHKRFQGQIKGTLMVNYYVKEIAMHNIPKNYDCLIKAKSYNTPENIYIAFGLEEITRKFKYFAKIISVINKDNVTELELIFNYLKRLEEFQKESYFISSKNDANKIRRKYGNRYPRNERIKIDIRFRKNKIKNERAYKNIIHWLDQFNNFNSIAFVDDDTLEMLRYDKKFTDTLFELWNLFKIKETLVNKFDFVEESNSIEFGKNSIFSLASEELDLEIYYQKGKGIYWNDFYERTWSYIKKDNQQKLVGIPDISIVRYEKTKTVVMIDIKNKIRRKGQNSEEIYKMIGYYSNFSDMFTKYYDDSIKKHSVLIFRNDNKQFSEKITDNNGTILLNASVSPSSDIELCNNQFKIICEHILTIEKR